MHTASSIQLPKRVDPKRKQLVKELQNDIKNIKILKRQNISTPKRKPSQDNEEYQNFDTLKKKQHMDQEAMKNGKLLKKNQKSYGAISGQNNSHEIPIKSAINSSINSEVIYQEDEIFNERTVKKQDTFTLPNISTFFPVMLDRQFPNLRDPSLGIFTDKQRLLITIQQKLDSFLLFVKENRKKKKGQFFSSLKRVFLENHRIFLQFSHIKKILFVDSNLYAIQKFGQGINIECIVDIKLKSNESDAKALEQELHQRKNTFPQKLLSLKEELKNISGEPNVQIPQVTFEFQAALEASKNILKTSLKNILDVEMMNKKKIDKFFVLQSKDSQQYQLSKKILEAGIKRVETIIQKQTQIDLKLFQTKMKKQKQLGQNQIESIIDEIHFIYKSKGVTNLLFDQLLDALSKKTIMSVEVLSKSLDIFIQTAPKINKVRPFLRPINHRNGRLIQIERISMDQFRTNLVKNDEWMKKFMFKMEMNDEYVKKTLQEERIKVFNEVKETVFDEIVGQNSVFKPKIIDANEMQQFDFSKVRPFIQKPVQPKSSISSDEEQEKEESEGEIGISRKLVLETQKMIREDRKKQQKKLKKEQQEAKQHQKISVPSKEKTIQVKEERKPSPQKYEFKSTLSNSDDAIYNEDE